MDSTIPKPEPVTKTRDRAGFILNWARDEGKIAAHYCDRLHRIYSVDRAEIVWTEADQQAFKDAAPSWVKRVMITAPNGAKRRDG